MYASFLVISEALYLGIFKQPFENRVMRQPDYSSSSRTHLLLSLVEAAVSMVLMASVIDEKMGDLQREIAARKETELELKKYRDHLEQLVEQRTVELSQTNEEIKRFAYIVSHDLRAPLVNIRGFGRELSLAMTGFKGVVQRAMEHLDDRDKKMLSELEDDMTESLGFISSSAARMDSQIKAILTLSRMGRRELVPEVVDMNQLVRDTLDSLSHQLDKSDTTVDVGQLPQIFADHLVCEQIFGNLLSNAVKYLHPDRKGQIDISGEKKDGRAVFYVRDNGRGIAPSDIPLIFELFRRVGDIDQPGEGMGLAYVQALVGRLGGKIRCESEAGNGSLFVVELPQKFEK